MTPSSAGRPRDAFAFQVQRHAAGDQQRQLRRLAREAGEIRGGLDDLLEVVEDEKHLASGHVLDQDINRGPASLLDHTKHACHRRRDELRIAHRGERYEVDAVRRGGHAARGRASRKT